MAGPCRILCVRLMLWASCVCATYPLAGTRYPGMYYEACFFLWLTLGSVFLFVAHLGKRFLFVAHLGKHVSFCGSPWETCFFLWLTFWEARFFFGFYP